MFDFQIQQPCNVCVWNHDHDEAIAGVKQMLVCPISYDKMKCDVSNTTIFHQRITPFLKSCFCNNISKGEQVMFKIRTTLFK